MSRPLISLKGVTFSYPGSGPDSSPVLEGINLEIFKGEWVSIIGPNAAGKSTLVKIMAGLLNPQQGSITYRDQDCPIPVGVVLSDPENQLVAQTVEEEIAFGLENLGLDPKEMNRRIDDILPAFGIGHLRSRLVDDLSGGEKQRLILAAVMVMSPPLLILDEPFLMLDVLSWEKVMGLLGKINRQGTAVVIMSQDPDPLPAVGRTVLLVGGKIILETDAHPLGVSPETYLEAGVSPPHLALVKRELASMGLSGEES